MRNWLTNNAPWLGALGAIAAIIATAMTFLPESGEKPSAQNLVIDGTNNEARQTQEKAGGSQTAIIRGKEHTATQKQ